MKIGFSIRNVLFPICFVQVWIEIWNSTLLSENQALMCPKGIIKGYKTLSYDTDIAIKYDLIPTQTHSCWNKQFFRDIFVEFQQINQIEGFVMIFGFKRIKENSMNIKKNIKS